MSSITNDIFSDLYVEPFKEMVAYEALWAKLERPTFKKVSERLQNCLPSAYFKMHNEVLSEYIEQLKEYDLKSLNTLIAGTLSYPNELQKLENFAPVLYYKGDIEYLGLPAVSIVGSRKASEQGKKIASEVASKFAHHDYAIVSGLAEGIDTAAHKAVIESDGKTIAVIGTPINETYPKENKDLQQLIERQHLLISQVPFIRYAINKRTNFRLNPKIFFPERNKIMAAITEATIIIEASNTSGTLIQARECLRVGKKLIIHAGILDNNEITWPETYKKRDNVYVAGSFDEMIHIVMSK